MGAQTLPSPTIQSFSTTPGQSLGKREWEWEGKTQQGALSLLGDQYYAYGLTEPKGSEEIVLPDPYRPSETVCQHSRLSSHCSARQRLMCDLMPSIKPSCEIDFHRALHC
ncbi:hypothetical protein Q5P01_024743 [Channa striata]|uniref:Uncharacterized protein n=1 Tax=Channa striata TaxID=64152 RepID=A0AA88IRH1_CHASR|nr:hypothetical protein Q5P01_024743 [Channa striata]